MFTLPSGQDNLTNFSLFPAQLFFHVADSHLPDKVYILDLTI